MATWENEAIKTLLGNPKRALVKLSLPIVMSMAAHALFQLADIIWVSGLGADAIAAVGFFNPLIIFAISIISGIAVGGGTRISQNIGAKDKAGADRIVIHLFIIIFCISILFVVPLLIFARPLFLYMGAEHTIELTLSYARIMIVLFFFNFFLEGASTVLRSEGDSKRPMKMYMTGIILNIILDPIFIYQLDLGVRGAALASLVSVLAATAIWIYWLFIKRITYVTIHFSGFIFEPAVISDILRLGIPVSLGQIFTALMILVNTKIVSYLGGPDGVAVYQGGLRFWNLTMLPVFGISSALTTVIGAAWGAKDIEKVKAAFRFALKLTLAIEGIMMILIIAGAPIITIIFTWSKDAERLSGDFIVFFRMFALLNIAGVLLFTIEALFVGVGQGAKKLLLGILRSLFFVVPLTLSLGLLFKKGIFGVWTGIAVGNWITVIVAVIFTIMFFRKIKNSGLTTDCIEQS